MDKRKKLVALLAGIMAAIMLLTIVLSLLSSTVSAASSSELKEQLDDLRAEYAQGQAKLDALEKQLADHVEGMQAMINQKNAIDQQISLLKTQVDTITQMVSAYNLLIADQQEELDAAQQRLDVLNEKYKERIRVMEEQGSLSYWSVIFNASSFSDMMDRIVMVNEIAKADAKRLEELRDLAAEVESAKEDLLSRKREMEETKLALQQAQEEMTAKAAEADLLLAELVALGEEYEKYIEEAEDAQHDLMVDIAQKEDAYDEAKYKEWLATSVPPTTTTGGGHTSNTTNGITWLTPTKNYYISSPFGYRWHPISGQWKMHYGIDMAAAQGTPIYATRTGVVTVAAYQEGGAGYYVKLNHGDGYTSIYMHMTHYIVKVGDYVTAGQVIGYVGSTGGSTGPHLHFGISYNGTYVNPANYIPI